MLAIIVKFLSKSILFFASGSSEGMRDVSVSKFLFHQGRNEFLKKLTPDLAAFLNFSRNSLSLGGSKAL